VIFDDFTAELLDVQSGILISGSMGVINTPSKNKVFGAKKIANVNPVIGDTVGASRFFYCAKPSTYERNKGLNKSEYKKAFPNGNDHVTVKPIALMRWLVKLVTPKGGICLDCYCGSGSTLIGCKMEHINYVGIDMDERNCLISEIRVSAWNPEKYIKQELSFK